MTEDPNHVNGAATEDQPEVEEENARANYQRAIQRLFSIFRRVAKAADTIDVLALQQDLAARSCELAAMQTLMIRAGVCTAEDIYREAAIVAVQRGSTILAQLEAAPRIAVPGDH